MSKTTVPPLTKFHERNRFSTGRCWENGSPWQDFDPCNASKNSEHSWQIVERVVYAANNVEFLARTCTACGFEHEMIMDMANYPVTLVQRKDGPSYLDRSWRDWSNPAYHSCPVD
jgi:hypothetical protein